MEGLILNLAPTGMVSTQAQNPRLPVSVAEIVADVRRCVVLGVNMLHLHARDERGQPTWKREVYARLIGEIRDVCPEVVICVSLSGRQVSEFDHRADPLRLSGDLKPDMGSLTLSSLNFSHTPSMNSPEMIARLAETMLQAGIKPENEVFDVGMLNYAHYLVGKGLLQAPFYFNFLLGNVASGQASPQQVGLMRSELPTDSLWVGGGIGASQLRMNAMGMLFGNGARVGLEDSLWMDEARGEPASNESLVRRAVEMAALFGRRLATPAELRTRLHLPARS